MVGLGMLIVWVCCNLLGNFALFAGRVHSGVNVESALALRVTILTLRNTLDVNTSTGFAHSLRSPASIDWGASKFTFGLLEDGCVAKGEATRTTLGTTLSLHFEAPVRFNGIYIETPTNLPALDPDAWIFEFSRDGQMFLPFAISGTCGFLANKRNRPRMSVLVEKLRLANLPLGRGVRVYSDYQEFRCRWPEIVIELSNLALCLTLLVGGVGSFFFYQSPRRTVSLGLMSAGLGYAFANAAAIFPDTIEIFVALGPVLSAAGLLCSDKYDSSNLLCFLLFELVAFSFYVESDQTDRIVSVRKATLVALMLLMLMLMLLIMYIRMYSSKVVRHELHKIAEDARRLDILWLHLGQQLGAHAAVKSIELCAGAIAVSMHVSCGRVRSWWWGTCRGGKGGGARHRSGKMVAEWHQLKPEQRRTAYRKSLPESEEIKCLDQVYFQAVHIAPMVREKVQLWAGLCNGCFPVRPDPHISAMFSGRGGGMENLGGSDVGWGGLVVVGGGGWAGGSFRARGDREGGGLLGGGGGGWGGGGGGGGRKESGRGGSGSGKGGGGLVEWREALVDPAKRARIEWPKIKSAQRALQKVSNRYGGEVSLLLDLVRYRIVIATLQQQSACLAGETF